MKLKKLLLGISLIIIILVISNNIYASQNKSPLSNKQGVVKYFRE